MEYAVSKATWSVLGFALGVLVASYGTRYHRIRDSEKYEQDEEEAFVSAIMNLNTPYP